MESELTLPINKKPNSLSWAFVNHWKLIMCFDYFAGIVPAPGRRGSDAP
ncbi:hypothetical protein tloyanaT_27410 [Thalassotalea loyana]|uniref:Uncharacterized protein n=1 Tax=Thalassotalea loyana TaxID=280483 RepID=A0ABQ6HEH0_9GAMM|nr:hypothetical protein tloyanaT_27410 [Thalassotalea loyana]